MASVKSPWVHNSSQRNTAYLGHELIRPVGGLGKVYDGVQHSLDLRGNHGQNLHWDAVELVKATPRACLAESLEDVGQRLVVHLVAAVEHVARQSQCARQILGRLRLASAFFPSCKRNIKAWLNYNARVGFHHEAMNFVAYMLRV